MHVKERLYMETMLICSTAHANTHAEIWLSRRFTTAEQMAAAQTIHNRCVRDLGPIGLEVGSHTPILLLEHKPQGFLTRHLSYLSCRVSS